MSASSSVSSAEMAIELVRETEAPIFVINLCASTTPVALTHPDNSELKRYTFFVTRQREEGRERFRLHMGYFETLAEAENLLAAVRDVYPAAWAGPAPGNKLPPRMHSVPKPAAAAVAVAAPAVAAPAVAAAAAPVVAAPETVKVASVAAPVVVPAAAQAAPVPAAVAAPVVAAPVPAEPEELTLAAMSNVHEVLAELADEPPRVQPSKPATSPAAPLGAQPPARIPELKAAAPRRLPELKAVATPAAPVAVQADNAEISDTQALRILEQRGVANAAPTVSADVTSIRMLTPEDTQTLRDIKLDVQTNAPVPFAVQLVWSVTPIDMDSLPHLAIFDAYTLYNVEGNRQGRRWYGVRLGFFTDVNAAKQVAYYVRSDFTSVAVVPVTTKERDRASGAGEGAPAEVAAGSTRAPLPPPDKLAESLDFRDAGFELLADDRPVQPKLDFEDVRGGPPARGAQVPTAHAARAPSAAAPAGAKAAAKKPTGKRVVVRKPRAAAPGAPTPLEETLEMLGASTLTIDEGRELLNDSGLRKQVVKPRKGSRFSRLLSSLSDRMGDSRR